MKIKEALAEFLHSLESGTSLSPRIEAEVLLRHTLSIDRAQFFASLDRELSDSELTLARSLLYRRMAGEPLAYITGQREFFGIDLVVTESVLVPRQETELLVEAVIEFADQEPSAPIYVADVGTGSGAIAVAVAKAIPNAHVYAFDISIDAIRIARQNAIRHAVDDRIEFIVSDLLTATSFRFDVIVSNPPYIPTSDMSELPADVQQEPHHALDGGADGLDIIRRLVVQASQGIKKSGLFLFEIDSNHGSSSKQLASEAFPNALTSVENDLSQLPRYIRVLLKN